MSNQEAERSKPWENKDGSTNVDGFLKAYAKDDNNFWRADSGHHQNVIDELIERADLERQKREVVEKESAFLINKIADEKDEKIQHLTSLLVRAEEALNSLLHHGIDGHNADPEVAKETLTLIQSHLKGVE